MINIDLDIIKHCSDFYPPQTTNHKFFVRCGSFLLFFTLPPAHILFDVTSKI